MNQIHSLVSLGTYFAIMTRPRQILMNYGSQVIVRLTSLIKVSHLAELACCYEELEKSMFTNLPVFKVPLTTPGLHKDYTSIPRLIGLLGGVAGAQVVDLLMVGPGN